MTKEQYRRKVQIVDAIMRTANNNGKNIDRDEAEYIADRLHRYEATLSRLAEQQCTFPVYNAAKQERTEKRAVEFITENIGCKCHTQRDPRGFTVRLYLDNYFNTWDGETTGMDW